MRIPRPSIWLQFVLGTRTDDDKVGPESGARKEAELLLDDRMGRGECRRMESVERTHTSLIGPGRSHSRPVSVFSYHGRLVAQVVAAERVRGRPRCSRWVSTMANQVPGGWVAVPCRTQASALSGVALGKLHKLPLGQGAGCSERDFQWKRAWQAAVKCSKSISSLPRQAAGPGVVTGEVTVGMRGSLSPGRTRLATGKLQSECTCTLHLTAHEQIMIDGEPCPPHKTSRALKVTTLGHCPYTKSRLRCLAGPERSAIPCCSRCWGQHSLRSEVEGTRN